MTDAQTLANATRRAASVAASWLVLASLLVASPWALGAGQFVVTPVRVFLQPTERATAITITNEGDEELVMQADIFVWKQKPDGEDELTPSEDLFLSPPIVRLAPKARQVVRLARVRPSPTPAQLSYRMIIREVPEVRAAAQSVQVQFALAFSMPVFVTPAGVRSEVQCTVDRTARETVRASCENLGKAYAQIRDLWLFTPSGERVAGREGGFYLLPTIKRSFDLRRAEGPIPSGRAKLAVSLDDGSTRTFDVTVAD